MKFYCIMHLIDQIWEENMKVVGLIAEYNPFHNGHQYHIEKARKITGADIVIVVMSGNFVQRGAPAIMPKHLRAEVALKAGASLVIELPVSYATGSAEFFAFGAVSLLDKLGCVDCICFGSECGDIEVLQNLARIIHDEPEEYKSYLSQYLRQGNSFPLARQKAMTDYLKSDTASDILAEPNNILGIEYLKALCKLESKIKPYTISRMVSHYHDNNLCENYSSASAIRKALSESIDFNLDSQVPEVNIPLMRETCGTRYPIYINDFSILLKYKLMSETKETLTAYADVSEELANRIYNHLNQFHSFEQFCELLKTKEITYSRISRSLLHVLLGIKQTNMVDIAYAHVLGFRKSDAELFSKIKKFSSIPIVTKLADTNFLSDDGKAQLEQDIYASNLYESVIAEKFKTIFANEYEHPIVRI